MQLMIPNVGGGLALPNELRGNH